MFCVSRTIRKLAKVSTTVTAGSTSSDQIRAGSERRSSPASTERVTSFRYSLTLTTIALNVSPGAMIS